ncbi:hypothetical protein AGOR_G00016590 [Albula goreensis]|uniref:Uncharacterized protein n=1 Tax=Albula goreensis TaxID=1534307 RepID=A0A8T3EAC5_9TELE|nr:hypothetical protein AGOR_G00016590 [Albula goreensis]
MSSGLATASGLTIHKISKSITLYQNNLSAAPAPPAAAARPLVLLFPWLGARPQALLKYWQLYLKAGFDMLTVESNASQFLWPRWGLQYGAEILEVLQREGFVSRPLLVHAFSIGGYTFTQLLVHMSREPQRYLSLTDRIKGHIYDSLVFGSLEKMAIGLGRTILPQLEFLVRWAALFYFWLFKSYTVDYFDVGIATFRNSPVKAPALFFYCENDAMCDHEGLGTMLEEWRRQGREVWSRKWAESTHAGHLRHHPEEYLSTLDDFLQHLNIRAPM